MKREIKFKFRAWHNHNKAMITSYQAIKTIVGHYLTGNDISKDYILMQYTGLKDKNDVEIYEGDIIKFYDEYVDGTMSSEVNIEDVEFYDCGFIPLANQCYSGENIEVIGNIYENPELLEV